MCLTFWHLTSFWHFDIFLGGLSLYLNHLIQSCAGISYQLFGSLSIGLLLSNLDSRQLETSHDILWLILKICQLLASPGPFKYFWQDEMSSENHFFLNEGATRLWWGLVVLGGQVLRLYGGTILGGWCNTVKGVQWGIENEGSIFWHICES